MIIKPIVSEKVHTFLLILPSSEISFSESASKSSSISMGFLCSKSSNSEVAALREFDSSFPSSKTSSSKRFSTELEVLDG